MSDFRLHPDVLWIQEPDQSSWLLHMGGNTCRLDASSTQLLAAVLADSSQPTLPGTSAPADPAPEGGVGFSDFVNALLEQDIIQPRRQRVRAGERLREAAARIAIRIALHAVEHLTWNRRRRTGGLLLVARWSIRQFGWADAVRAWNLLFPGLAAASGPVDPPTSTLIDRLVREAAARALLRHECKERALACLALARTLGFEAHLVLGLAYVPLAAHVWAESGDHLLGDETGGGQLYDRVARYGRNGWVSLRSPLAARAW